MNYKKFWNWKEPEEKEPRTLFLNGTIAEESWFEDDVTPYGNTYTLKGHRVK